MTSLIALVLAPALLTPAMSARANALWTITEKVVDGNGTTIPKVVVTVYTENSVVTGQSGEYYKSVKTNEAGSYKVVLDYAKYKLEFDKEGYLSGSVEVDTTKAAIGDFDISLQDIVLNSSLSLVSVPSSLQVHEGETVTVSFTFRNDGAAGTVNVVSTISTGYDVMVLNQDKQPVDSVYVPSGTTCTLSLQITVPLAANDTVVRTMIAGSSKLEFSLDLRVVESRGSVLTCSYPGRDLNPNDAFDFVVTLENQHYYEKTYNLTLTYPSGWNVAVKNEAGQKASAVVLEGQGSATLHVSGTVPSNCTAGSYSIILNEADGDNAAQLPLQAQITVKPMSEKQSLDIVSKYPSQSIQLGVKTVYPLSISMNGTKALVSLSTEGVPDGWEVSFVTTDGRTVNSILMDPAAAEDIAVEVTPSLSSSRGSYSFKVVAAGGGTSASLSLIADVEGSYNVSMSVDNLYLQTSAQSTQTAAVTVTNTGYSPLNNVELEVSYPDGWDISSSPLKVTTLVPNQAQTFTLTIIVPSGASPKDYLVTLKAAGDEASTAEQTIRVTVAVESSWTIWGIGLLVLAVAAFGLIFTRMRRR